MEHCCSKAFPRAAIVGLDSCGLCVLAPPLQGVLGVAGLALGALAGAAPRSINLAVLGEPQAGWELQGPCVLLWLCAQEPWQGGSLNGLQQTEQRAA